MTARVPVDGTSSTADGSNRSDATDDRLDKADKQKDLNEKRRVSSDAMEETRLEHGLLPGPPTVPSSSKEADVILEEVLDFSDLTTLAM